MVWNLTIVCKNNLQWSLLPVFSLLFMGNKVKKVRNKKKLVFKGYYKKFLKNCKLMR